MPWHFLPVRAECDSIVEVIGAVVDRRNKGCKFRKYFANMRFWRQPLQNIFHFRQNCFVQNRLVDMLCIEEISCGHDILVKILPSSHEDLMNFLADALVEIIDFALVQRVKLST